MTRWGIIFLVIFCLSGPFFATGQDNLTSRQRFEKLAHKLHLKTPKLADSDYEVRIWNKQSIVFGDAHTLYTVTKTERALNVLKYTISWNGPAFKRAMKFRSTTSATDSLWKHLLRENILTLPNEEAISQQLHPRPPKDSTWTSVEADGSISIHAKKTESSVLIGDGEGYYFEIFSSNSYRSYSYSNPREYIRYKPDITELQNVVAILNELATLFRPSN